MQATISVDDWDKLVVETYGKPYSFQQQDGCRPRISYNLTIPVTNAPNDGVQLQQWLEASPPQEGNFFEELRWKRDFYPHVQVIANDLHKRGLIQDGDYTIKVDW